MQDRIGNAIWEVAVRLVIDLDDSNWQVFFKKVGLYGIDHRSCSTITRIHHEFDRFDFFKIYIRTKVLKVIIENRYLLIRTSLTLINFRKSIFLCKLFYL